MVTDKEILYQQLQEIREELTHNERADGAYAFDVKRVQVALDFAKQELESCISEAGREGKRADLKK